jgi:transposase
VETREFDLGSPVLLASGPERDMLTRERWQAIADLTAKGWSRRSIAAEVGVDVRTVRRYLRQGGWRPRQRRVVETLLDRYADFVLRRAPEVGYRSRILVRELREQGYEGSYRTVARFVEPLREARRRQEEATVRFETPPGKQSQVDFGSTRLWFGEGQELVHLFVMALGFSRRMYVRGYTSERLASLIDGHERAFAHFGGRTEEILYDNPRTIVLERDLEGHFVRWNPVFRDFADYHGFEPRLCRVRRARTKGKVERGIGYFKGNALPGKRWHGMEHFNEWALEWATSEADLREHGTTHERPIDRFGREGLLPVDGGRPYRVERSLRRIVSDEALVQLWSSRYSVPYRFVGEEVTVIQTPNEVAIYHDGERIAVHAPAGARHRVVRDAAHYEGLLRVARDRRRPEPPRFDPRFVGTDLVEVRDLGVYEAIAAGGER